MIVQIPNGSFRAAPGKPEGAGVGLPLTIGLMVEGRRKNMRPILRIAAI
jgi:hypothetical protein